MLKAGMVAPASNHIKRIVLSYDHGTLQVGLETKLRADPVGGEPPA